MIVGRGVAPQNRPQAGRDVSIDVAVAALSLRRSVVLRSMEEPPRSSARDPSLRFYPRHVIATDAPKMAGGGRRARAACAKEKGAMGGQYDQMTALGRL